MKVRDTSVICRLARALAGFWSPGIVVFLVVEFSLVFWFLAEEIVPEDIHSPRMCFTLVAPFKTSLFSI